MDVGAGPIGRNAIARATLAFCLALLWSKGVWAQSSAHCPEPNYPPIPSIRAFRQLTREQADKCLPVHLTATVTVWDSKIGQYFVQEAGYGVYLLADLNESIRSMKLKPGDRVEIDGATSGGDISFDIWPTRVRLLSTGTVPKAIRVTGYELGRNRYDSLLVEFTGTLISTMTDPEVAPQGIALYLDVEGQTVKLQVHRWSGEPASSLIGSRLHVTGIAGAIFNSQGMFLAPLVYVLDRSAVISEDPGQDPYQSPLVSISEVLRNPSGEGLQTLAHVHGVVTGTSRERFYLEENGHALLVKTNETDLPKPGDLVEALGHPNFGGFGAVLEHAVFRRTGATEPPRPLRTSASRILGQGAERDHLAKSPIAQGKARVGATYSDRLVVLDAELVNMVSYTLPVRNAPAVFVTDLFLRDGAVTFPAHLEASGQQSVPRHYESGTTLRLAGICRFELPIVLNGDPRAFELIVRDAHDIEVLALPAWWTSGRLLTALAAAALVIVGALLWVRLLHRKVREQTSALRDAKEAAEAACRAKSEFLANMSHEMRTPLNGVIGMLSVILDGPIDEDTRPDMEIIGESAESLLAIINDVLDLSKVEAGQMSLEPVRFDLRRLLEQALKFFAPKAQEKKLTLRLVYDSELAEELIGDEFRIRQIILNLVGNAIKFTHEGEVAVLVEHHQRSNDTVVRITVRDTGIGIRPEDYGKLFQKFTQADASTTRKYGGTGLGLTISRHVAELMGGLVGFSSQFGKGSSFWVEIPLEVPVAPELAAGVDESRQFL